ncbi:hypothetical protein TNCV_3058451 [Trichonephila clavipes]|nr:hypothetical protein TNCV_3058451 [Trichonephila clavipes]
MSRIKRPPQVWCGSQERGMERARAVVPVRAREKGAAQVSPSTLELGSKSPYVAKNPRVAEQGDVNIPSLSHRVLLHHHEDDEGTEVHYRRTLLEILKGGFDNL